MLARAHVLSLAAALAVAASTPAAWADSPAAAAPAPAYGVNLVANGDAEAELGAPDSSTIVKPSGWTTTGQFTAVRYGASGGFADKTSPGPKDRGKSLFEGGNVALSTASQSIALDGYAAGIDAGVVSGTFSSWLGGFSSQDDHATVSLTVLSASGRVLLTAHLGPIFAAGRKGVTGLFASTKTIAIPKGARKALISIEIKREEGTYNDGSVDNVSLVLTKIP